MSPTHRPSLRAVLAAVAVAPMLVAAGGAGGGPTVRCAAPDGEWHAENVALRCTATDPQGLAVREDAAFLLRTTLPAGTESASAATGTRRVCDTKANCVTAGPIAGNRVDLKPPTVALRQPAQNGRYGLLARHGVRFVCGDAGSGIYSCEGTAPEGTQVPTGPKSLGPHTFVVIGQDRAGNRTKVRHAYRIEPVTLSAGPVGLRPAGRPVRGH